MRSLPPTLAFDRSEPPRWVWTLVGIATIPLWGTWPALATQSDALPPLEFLTLCFATAALFLWPLERHKPIRHLPRAWLISVAFGLGEVGSAVFFLAAIRVVPPAEANMAVYSWPAMVAGLAALLGLQVIGVRQLVGIVLGFAGTALLFIGSGPLIFDPRGVGLALLAGLSWALYCVLRLKWPEDIGAFLGRGALVAGAVCALFHLLSEHTQLPTPRAWVAAAAVGAMPTAIANVLWDLGMRRGDSQLLTVLAYATPLAGAVLLALLGMESFTWRLAVVGCLIGVAGFLSSQAPRTSAG